MRTKFAVLATLLALTACVHMTPEKKVVNSLYSIGKTVNTAYACYTDQVLAGRVPTKSFPVISGYYKSFQLVFSNAVNELPHTNSIPIVLEQGRHVLSAINRAEKGKGVP